MRRFWLILFCSVLAANPAALTLNSPVDSWRQLSVEDLELLRASIEARRGRFFDHQDIRAYLRRQDWYQPNPYYTRDFLSRAELKNIELIKEIENSKLREGLYDEKEPVF
ncbi:hypothetical protein NO2_0943 [Candidatus Termititenax persephonae]|uniref:YARHG domain-containing protein n=1 Tax=Candidatus Termititenax persephonae TaxID=2218525 RepID=A0A388THN6_9BACT|nr:hypothetical protein NO2_0943 [Candidatus Termititenax persephonae]